MQGFTALEEAALRDICRMFPAEHELLEEQLATATVSKRENTGAGFYTYFDLQPDVQKVSGERMRSGGWAHVDGFKNPIGFILWLGDGRAKCLEGFTVDDSTVDVDFSRLDFRLVEAKSECDV
ncbi:MAG TPA: hypothetical protein VGM17_18330 [Rhizomicrobium sp.]|jgi:hypothetical protein